MPFQLCSCEAWGGVCCAAAAIEFSLLSRTIFLAVLCLLEQGLIFSGSCSRRPNLTRPAGLSTCPDVTVICAARRCSRPGQCAIQEVTDIGRMPWAGGFGPLCD